MLNWIYKILAIIITAPIFASIVYLLFSPILSRFSDKVKNFAVITFLILSIFVLAIIVISVVILIILWPYATA